MSIVLDLNCVSSLIPLQDKGDLAKWKPGSAWLAGGTWLFSEPQPTLDTLLDLASLKWTPIECDNDGVRIAATCTFAQLYAFSGPPEFIALWLFEACCRSLLGSFKIWNMATVGGNICLALPAGPMTALTVALDGVGVVWTPDGSERRVPIIDLVTGPTETSLAPGEILRQIELPAHALRRRAAHRRVSLTSGGRSGALLIGTRDKQGFALTVTASTKRPIKLRFDDVPSADDLKHAIEAAIPFSAFYDDIHGRPDWRQHLTFSMADEIREELAGS